MATARLILEMVCYHDTLGEHEFDLSKKPEPMTAERLERVKQIQKCIMLMGARKKLEDPKEAAEFLLKR